MTEIEGKSILVRVSARFELARVQVIGGQLYIDFSKPKSGAHIRKQVITIIILIKINMKEKESKPNDKKAMSMKTYFRNFSFKANLKNTKTNNHLQKSSI